VPIFLAVGNDRQFRTLCTALGCAEIPDDPRFSSNALRNQNRDALRAILSARFAAQEGEALTERLMAAGVPCGPVRGLDAVASHPHTRHSEMLVAIENYAGTASPIKFGRTKATYRRKPPVLGEHNDDILARGRPPATE
jgi:formyl-CoA transferase